jgi:serine protease Do
LTCTPSSGRAPGWARHSSFYAGDGGNFNFARRLAMLAVCRLGKPEMKKVLWSLLFLFGVNSAYAKDLPDFADLVEKHGVEVVNISTTAAPKAAASGPNNVPEDDPMFDFFRRFIPQPMPRGEEEGHSLGSGFVVSADGYILTNAHVVAAGDDITVTLNDKREFKAKVIGADRRTDVALIKIEASALQAVKFGDPSKVRAGDWVLAIGSPFGFDNTVTAGIVSAKGRSLPQENYVPFIQTDVAINPGNSGGPLYNLSGEVVGINSQIYSRTGGFMGLSFAIPIDVAMDISNQLKTAGKVTRGWLGVVIQEVTKDLADSFGLSKTQGALIANVERGGPADKAGLEISDIILKFDNKDVKTSSDLPRMVGSVKPGSKVNLQVWHKGSTKETSVTVGELPAEKVAAMPASKRGKNGESANKLGLALSDLGNEQRKELKINSGVLVEDVKGPAARAGIQPGDVILAINNSEVKTVEQFNQALNKLESRKNLALLVKRGESTQYITVRMEQG